MAQSFLTTMEILLGEALDSPQAKEWKNVVIDEVSNILIRNTWKIVDRPTSETVIGSRFVLTNKPRSDGNVARKKARLVAKGFSQRPGIDFKQSFASVARLESLRLLMALSTKLKMTIRQIDAITAYLNSNLEEPVCSVYELKGSCMTN